jgi:hypothetical protein
MTYLSFRNRSKVSASEETLQKTNTVEIGAEE